MRVLLIAEDCNPEWPSLPVVGYNACKGIAEHVETVVATHIRNKENIEKIGMGRAQVVYIDNEYIAAPMYRLAKWLRGGESVGWTTNIAMQYLPYLAFEWEIWKKLGSQIKARHFDIVHRVTPMSPTLPSPLCSWSNGVCIPFVLGPLNGGLPWPSVFTKELKKEKEWLTYVRNAYRWLPFARSTLNKTKVILAAFQHTINQLSASQKEKTIDFPEVGIDPSLFAAPDVRESSHQVTFLFAGRLVPYKCPDVVVSAFAANSELRKHRLIIAGDGPELPYLEKIVRENHLEDCVELIGRKTQAEIGHLMRKSDVFAFPSIRELGAGVVVEAMACGMTCIVVDYGGPGGLIHAGNGIKIPIGDKQHLIDCFAYEMALIANEREKRVNYGLRAHQDAMQLYSWTNKGLKTLEVYQWALGRRQSKPNFYDS
jgi:glycosyltransferase involved in cell wall biosynthesis